MEPLSQRVPLKAQTASDEQSESPGKQSLGKRLISPLKRKGRRKQQGDGAAQDAAVSQQPEAGPPAAAEEQPVEREP